MVKLEELEDEHFVNKPASASEGALLVDDEDDYTDTGRLHCAFSIHSTMGDERCGLTVFALQIPKSLPTTST